MEDRQRQEQGGEDLVAMRGRNYLNALRERNENLVAAMDFRC
jgi:hypothetical protein